MFMCFFVYLVLLNLPHSELNTIETDGHLFTDFLKVILIKIKFLVSVVKYTFIKVAL